MPFRPEHASTSAAAAAVLSIVAIAACSARSDLDGVSDARHSELPAGEATVAGGRRGDPPRKALAPDGTFDPSVGCRVDADCLRVSKGCCNLGDYVAVTKANADAYQQSLSCEAVSCPLVMIADDGSVAQCDEQTNTCAVVLPKDIECNGFTLNPHACPEGWQCRLPPGVPDVPGRCLERCGGFAGLQCSDARDQCIDDPDDDCDPSRGGADCGGLCIPSGT